MKLSWKVYFILLIVFIGSFLLASLLPAAEISRQLVAMPGGLALIGCLYQMIRDEAAHQKELLLQQDQQLFDLAATSHMANVAFDKHVLFCEEYIKEMHDAISTLYKEGTTSQAMVDHGNRLFHIQRKHAAWLTPDIEKGLAPFEQALRDIGASAYLYNADPGVAHSTGSIEKARNLLLDILGLKKEPFTTVDQTVAVTTVLAHLRKILGIEELTFLRQRLLYYKSGQPDFRLILNRPTSEQ